MPYKFKKLYLYHVRLHKINIFLNMSHKCANSGKKPWQYPASQTGGGISEVGLHPDREICPVFRIPRVLVQAAVDQVTALGEERNASRNLPVEIDPQVGGKGTSTLPKLSAPDAASNW